jgi:hypothetical protein
MGFGIRRWVVAGFFCNFGCFGNGRYCRIFVLSCVCSGFYGVFVDVAVFGGEFEEDAPGAVVGVGGKGLAAVVAWGRGGCVWVVV